MFIFRNPLHYIVYETPADGGSGPAGVQPAPGGTPPAGQGAEQPEGFWNLFPSVPQEHRQLLEPHIRQIQGHVTQLEQQMAPYKPFLQSGVTPEAAAGLLQFSAAFDQDPRAMWIHMGRQLQGGDNPVIDPEIDFDHLDMLTQGQDPEQQMQGFEQNPAFQGMPPELAQYVHSLQQQVEDLSGQFQQQQIQSQERVQDQLFQNQLSKMRGDLEKSGWPQDLVPDDTELTARLLVHNGDADLAVKAMVDTRSGLLRGAMPTPPTGEQPPVTMPEGPPPTTPKPKEPKDSWGKARQSATARLRRSNSAAAQNT